MERLEDIYHEMCLIEIEHETLKNSGLRPNVDYTVKSVDVPDFDYSKSPQWLSQKSISMKEYKKLKEIEFKIRNK